ncbi:MAG: DUF3048 domain-containing protein [Christensenellales bacterium]|jgi:predicted small lipoprotein YifL
MKRIVMVAMALILAFLLTACGTKGPDVTATQSPKATVPQEADNAESGVVPTVTPKRALSYTTGLPFEGEYKPVMVIIENTPGVRPQTGLQTADVVYELTVEGNITRFLCVYSDHVPEEVMPVRSARIPFLYIQNEWDSVLMHYGGAGSGPAERNDEYSFYGHKLYDEIKFDVDGWSGHWNKYFYRVSGISAPHNVMGNPLLAQALYNYNPEPLHWLFDSNAAYPGDGVSKIKLKMCTGDEDFISYTYDPKNDVYLRFMGDKPFKSAETGAQLTVKNVIVQYSTFKVSETRKLWKMVGSGNADIYIGGKLVKGSWERKSDNDRTVFYDDKGSEIVLRPGNTWIHIHPEE